MIRQNAMRIRRAGLACAVAPLLGSEARRPACNGGSGACRNLRKRPRCSEQTCDPLICLARSATSGRDRSHQGSIKMLRSGPRRTPGRRLATCAVRTDGLRWKISEHASPLAAAGGIDYIANCGASAATKWPSGRHLHPARPRIPASLLLHGWRPAYLCPRVRHCSCPKDNCCPT
jgi:hypothetical protein